MYQPIHKDASWLGGLKGMFGGGQPSQGQGTTSVQRAAQPDMGPTDYQNKVRPKPATQPTPAPAAGGVSGASSTGVQPKPQTGGSSSVVVDPSLQASGAGAQPTPQKPAMQPLGKGISGTSQTSNVQPKPVVNEPKVIVDPSLPSTHIPAKKPFQFGARHALGGAALGAAGLYAANRWMNSDDDRHKRASLEPYRGYDAF